jgi:hypothetical protein
MRGRYNSRLPAVTPSNGGFPAARIHQLAGYRDRRSDVIVRGDHRAREEID